MDTKERFDKALEQVKTLPERPANNELLDLYGLFKQATDGDVQGKRPGMLDLKGRAKYDAWASRRGMAREEAMKAYADYVDKLLG